MKQGLHGSPQDIGGARAVGGLNTGSGASPRERSVLSAAEAGRAKLLNPLKSYWRTEVCLACFWSYVGPRFPQCVPFLSFGMITHSLPYCRLGVYNLPFDFTGTYNKEIFLSLRIDFGL